MINESERQVRRLHAWGDLLSSLGLLACVFAAGLIQAFRDPGVRPVYVVTCATLVTLANVLLAWSRTCDLRAMVHLSDSMRSEMRLLEEIQKRVRKEGQE